MNPIPAQSLVEALQWRYSVKKFDPARKIPAELWSALEQALVLAPSSFGIQPWKFIAIEDPALRHRLAAASHGQTQPTDCSHFVVFAVRRNLAEVDVDQYVDRIVEVRGGSREALRGYRDSMITFIEKARSAGTLEGWCSRQVYIALGQFITSAALLGVDTSPMEGINLAHYDNILGLPAEGLGALCACAAGYRAADDKYAHRPKVRFKPERVLARH
jgi:nitroreductase